MLQTNNESCLSAGECPVVPRADNAKKNVAKAIQLAEHPPYNSHQTTKCVQSETSSPPLQLRTLQEVILAQSDYSTPVVPNWVADPFSMGRQTLTGKK